MEYSTAVQSQISNNYIVPKGRTKKDLKYRDAVRALGYYIQKQKWY